MKKEIKKTFENLTVTVNIERTAVDNIAYADGDNIKIGVTPYECIEVSINKDGKKAFTRNTDFIYVLTTAQKKPLKNNMIFARFGDTYIGEDVYNKVMLTIADAKKEVPGDADYLAAKKAEADKAAAQIEANKKAAADYADLVASPGYCTKCGSWCYGDCQAY